MATNGSGKTPLRIVVGSDNAGHAYKTALKEELKKHAGVTQVLDVGVNEADDSTAYPHLAVDACKKIKSGEVSSSRSARRKPAMHS
jgi:ribose 5-phosphate isomerase B